MTFKSFLQNPLVNFNQTWHRLSQGEGFSTTATSLGFPAELRNIPRMYLHGRENGGTHGSNVPLKATSLNHFMCRAS